MSIVSKPDSRFAPGVVLSGKFRVLRVLGQGGMGIVLAAHHLVLDQPVALKILLPPEEGERPQAVERFIREARALAQLHSAHIARVLDVGALEDGLPFMVMELLDGEDLQSTLEREANFSQAFTRMDIGAVAQMSCAAGYSHQAPSCTSSQRKARSPWSSFIART